MTLENEQTHLLRNDDSLNHQSIERTESQHAPPLKSWQKLKPHIRPLLAAHFISILIGLNDGALGIVITCFKSYYDIPDNVVSLLFLFNACGVFISASINGWLVHKIGQRRTMYLGAAAVLVAYSSIMQGFPFKVTIALMMLEGAGAGLLDAAMNVYTANVPESTLMLNILHAVYGVGAMISPLVATSLLAHDFSWRFIYLFLATMAFVNLCSITVGFKGVNFEENDEEEQEGYVKSTRKEAIFNRVTLLAAAYILVYVGLEVTLGGWGYSYLTTGRHGDPYQMGHVLSGYWAGLAAGRIALGYLAGRFGEKRMISLFTVISMLLLGVLWFVADIVVDSLVYVALGFLLGPMFPTTISLVSRILPRDMHATSIGFMGALAAGGAAFFPFLTGQFSGRFGILALPMICLAMAVMMQVMWLCIPNRRTLSI
ncbi:major facilitator superfamily domain-containing protein [Radiomyces spectabilis]|uniref:major facilitator superfamily domain-containing protein n=1 Tax=Radiomyces spectabilis TaxID=64574 RepID=UPI00221E7115|nr:major facilitator superfamily domain-containing protein [Radiomyces spectabilis]KAI8377852.1 major facilitator superfamily domain-containing protein [Radiomyces spectabilis]